MDCFRIYDLLQGVNHGPLVFTSSYVYELITSPSENVFGLFFYMFFLEIPSFIFTKVNMKEENDQNKFY